MVSTDSRAEIDALYADYVDALDNAEFERWPELFTDTCLYRIVSRENFARNLPISLMWCDGKGMLHDRIHAYVNLVTYTPRSLRHIVSNLKIVENSDGFTVRANYAIFQTRLDEASQVFNVGSYHDVIVRDGGTLKFREKICVYDTTLIDNAVVHPI